jgi:hypothetical protein
MWCIGHATASAAIFRLISLRSVSGQAALPRRPVVRPRRAATDTLDDEQRAVLRQLHPAHVPSPTIATKGETR